MKRHIPVSLLAVWILLSNLIFAQSSPSIRDVQFNQLKVEEVISLQKVDRSLYGGGIYDAKFSPDGKYIAFSSFEIGRGAQMVIYNLTKRIRTITIGGGTEFWWSADGKYLLFLSGSTYSIWDASARKSKVLHKEELGKFVGWHKGHRVVFLTGGQYFDLDPATMDSKNYGNAYPENSVGPFDVDSWKNFNNVIVHLHGRELYAEDRISKQRKTLVGGSIASSYKISPDNQYVLLMWGKVNGDGNNTLYTTGGFKLVHLGVRDFGEWNFMVSADIFKDLPENEFDQLKNNLARNPEKVVLAITGANYNPYNNALLGSDGKEKARGRIKGMNDQYVWIELFEEKSPVKAGDLVSTVWFVGGALPKVVKNDFYEILKPYSSLQKFDMPEATEVSAPSLGLSEPEADLGSMLEMMELDDDLEMEEEEIPEVEAFSGPGINDDIKMDLPPSPLNMRDVSRMIGYPQVARDGGIEGKVIARVLVGPNGEYRKHVITRKVHPMLSNAVEAHIGKLEFSPAKYNGKAISAWTDVPFDFKLLR